MGKTVKFSQEMWNKIRQLVGLSSDNKIEEVTSVSVVDKKQSNVVPNEIDLTTANARKFTDNKGTEKYVVRVNGENVRYSSMDIEYDKDGKLIGYIQHFPEGDMAYDAQDNLLPNGIYSVQTFRTEKQQTEYRTALKNAKTILLDNATDIGLSKEEVKLINGIDIESINSGAARFDKQRGVLLFNMNDENTPDENAFVKVIIHELTHATKGNPEQNSQAEERMCETRAIKAAIKLINAEKIKTFMLPPLQKGQPPVDIMTLTNDKLIDDYINGWLIQCGYDKRLPKDVVKQADGQ